MTRSDIAYTERFIKRHHSKIKRICEPLPRCFGINYFTYHSVDPNGAWIPLVSRLDWADFYTENQLCLQDPFLLHPRQYHSGSFLWAHSLTESHQQEIMQLAVTQFDMDHGLCIIERTPHGCEFFGFSAPKNHFSIYRTYLNDMPLLRQFCLYFKEEMKSTLEIATKNPIDLLGLKGDAFLNNTPPSFSSAQAAIQFSQFIQSPTKYNLSKQEKECLSIYLDELSMKEAAFRMGLSPRTIESYLVHIKDKLDCRTKEELIKKGRELRAIGIIQ